MHICSNSHLLQSNITSLIGSAVWLNDWGVKSKGYWHRTAFWQQDHGALVLSWIIPIFGVCNEVQKCLTFVCFPQLGTQRHHSRSAAMTTLANMMQTEALNQRKCAFCISGDVLWHVFGNMTEEYIKKVFFWDIQGRTNICAETCCWTRLSCIDHKNKMMNQIYHRATVSLFPERLPTFSGKLLHKPNLSPPNLYHPWPPWQHRQPDSVRKSSFRFLAALFFLTLSLKDSTSFSICSIFNMFHIDVAALPFFSAIFSFMDPDLEQPSIVHDQVCRECL